MDSGLAISKIKTQYTSMTFQGLYLLNYFFSLSVGNNKMPWWVVEQIGRGPRDICCGMGLIVKPIEPNEWVNIRCGVVFIFEVCHYVLQWQLEFDIYVCKCAVQIARLYHKTCRSVGPSLFRSSNQHLAIITSGKLYNLQLLKHLVP